ncbi:hypothetical protein N7505_007761 [Penicillium chrysogenum]|uniref:Transcription factor domain-containing protein n=1 Tax=Penicillium chrysogenum TaxID=5076 RepID=A0ABQ8WEZ6_PENCH|nr:hypothetical protein N7505_007761 [Penicillium chrysogenum]
MVVAYPYNTSTSHIELHMLVINAGLKKQSVTRDDHIAATAEIIILAVSTKEAPLPKQEKATQLVLDRLSQIESRMEERAIRTDEHFAKWQGKMQELMHFDLARGVEHPPPTVPEHLAPPPPVIKQNPPLKAETPQPKVSLNVLGASKFGQKLPPMGPRIDHKEAEGELSIPVEHTTAAHKLLMWPSIKRLLYPAKYDEDYVMRLEEERGLISIYGQGEISYTADNSQLPMECGSKGAQPNGNSAGPDANVDIDEFGNLDLDATTARRYYDSYFERMFKLHPFLMEGELRIKVDRFIRHYCRLNNSPPSSVFSYTRPARDGPPPAKKRQSNENLSVRDEFTKIISSSPRPRVGKNIDNALVLLCLALGAICEAPAPLPGPVMDKIDYLNQPIPASLTPFPSPPPANTTYVTDAHGVLPPANSVSAAMQMPLLNLYSVPAQPAGQNVSNISSNNDIEGLSRKDATNTQDKQGNTRNYLAIPGLALYGYATAILGHLQGGNELEHVQCGLLAGLYAGQLAHPFQSHSWISQASRACQILVRIKRYEQLDEGATKDLYNFAYWTCLQLESDLLAELDVPASGISRSEGRIPIPKGKWTIDLPNDPTAPNTMMMLFYSAQIHLRKLLDRVHTDLYKVDKQGKTRWSSTVQKTLSWNLDLWRESLPKSMQWDESDPPANEINAARMRAKYYGARYIIHRPLLYDALHWQEPKVHFHELPEELRAACMICIESAIKSTEAFDGVGGPRLVVTNIFGTAHAQFGNMLVLSATYISSLKELVEPEQLKRLLARTIWFLIQNENISPTLRADARILTEIYMKIFSEPPDLRQGTRMSFL